MKYGFYRKFSSRSAVQKLLHLSQSWARREQFTIPYPVSEWSTVIFVSNDFFAYGFLSDIWYAFLISITRATYLSFCEASFTLNCEVSRADPNRKAPNRTDPKWFSLDRTPTFLKVIHLRCVANQYLICANSHTLHYNILNQITSFELFQVNIRPYQFKSYQ